MVLTILFAACVIAFAGEGRWVSLPFLTIFVTGYGYVAFFALQERLSHARSVS